MDIVHLFLGQDSAFNDDNDGIDTTIIAFPSGPEYYMEENGRSRSRKMRDLALSKRSDAWNADIFLRLKAGTLKVKQTEIPYTMLLVAPPFDRGASKVRLTTQGVNIVN